MTPHLMRQLLSSASKSMKEDRIEEEEQDVEIKTIKPSSLLKILLADNHKIRTNIESESEKSNHSDNKIKEVNIKFDEKLDESSLNENGSYIFIKKVCA